MLKTIEKHIKIAEDIAKKNHGLLPCYSWLIKNGYCRIYPSIKNYPEKFSHIKQEHKHKTVEEKVKIAEDLAKKNNGILPSYSWLQKNGYNRIIATIYQYPEKFSHIEQEHKQIRKPIKEHVKLAEKLAKEHDGILYSGSWLNKNGYAGLVSAIRRHPEKFKHIKQEIKNKIDIEDVFKLATKLAKENNGILPYPNWLSLNGYKTLCYALNKYPEKFKSIKQERKRGNGLKEYTKLVKQLSRENNGILPGAAWLIKNGYANLYYYVLTHPKEFKHIKRTNRESKRVLNIENTLKLAKKIAKEHNGILPCSYWLIKNGYRYVNYATKKYPEKFRNIKQEYGKNKIKPIITY